MPDNKAFSVRLTDNVNAGVEKYREREKRSKNAAINLLLEEKLIDLKLLKK